MRARRLVKSLSTFGDGFEGFMGALGQGSVRRCQGDDTVVVSIEAEDANRQDYNDIESAHEAKWAARGGKLVLVCEAEHDGYDIHDDHGKPRGCGSTDGYDNDGGGWSLP